MANYSTLAPAFAVLACFSAAAEAQTDYPLTLENCGQSVTFEEAPQNAVAAKLVAAVAQLGVRHVLASDALLAPLEALLPPSARVLGASRLQQTASEAPCEACEAAVISDGDVLCYQLTSGSTGTPKAVPETHAAVIAHIRHSAQDCG